MTHSNIRNFFAPKLMTALTLPVALAGLLATGNSIQAQPIVVPNHSFETDNAPAVYPFVNTNVVSWEKNPEPGYFGPLTGGFPPWAGTAGVFLDVNPYTNHIGNQVGYILGFPGVALFQDYDSTPTHDFNATYEIGKSYNMTIGVFGKNSLAPGSSLVLSLYYRDGSNSKVTVGSTTVVYSPAAFSMAGPLGLVDYQVNVPTVQAGDAWAGQHIGIQLESVLPFELITGGNWDFDNVRLTAVPEPGSLSLFALGAGGLMLARTRSRRSA